MSAPILVGVLALAATPALAKAPATDCMDRAGSQSQMNTCAGADLQRADAELNQVYQAVLKRYADDPAFVARLRAAERAWIAFRDAELAARYPAADPRVAYGSVYPMCMAQARAELIRARTAQLQRWLDGVHEGEVCAGSISPAADAGDPD